jgi:hypothetical protein
LVILVLAGAYSFRTIWNIPADTGESPDVIARRNVATVLREAQVKIEFESEGDFVPQSVLPKDLRELILGGAIDLRVREAAADGGRPAYIIDFLLEGSVLDFYRQHSGRIRNGSVWTIISGLRTDTYALFELDGKDYVVRVGYTQAGDTVEVNIQAVLK